MTDRENVIRLIEEEISVCESVNQCYRTIDLPALRDILTLLKKQESVEPKQVYLYGKEDWYGLVCVCPDCKAEWMSDESETHFCPNCGQAVKWYNSRPERNDKDE